LITDIQVEPSDFKADDNLGHVWLIFIVASMGGLLFGWANSFVFTECLAGALAAGALSNKCGRKRLLVAAAMIFAGTSWAPRLANVIASDAVKAIPNLCRLPHNCPITACNKMGRMTNISFGTI
jgi:MFS family permease